MVRYRGLVALAACLSLLGPPARAEIQRPAQFDRADALGLAYTRIQPSTVKRVCLVDSGVTANADTGRVVSRLALDGSSGEDSDAAGRHGTSMAMHMGAEPNGLGMVGVWPSGEIVSYRVTRERREVGFVDYSRAISACAEDPFVGVINISLVSSSAATVDERRRIADVVADARGQGIVVVAAAGNDGGEVGSPADEPGVLAVAAGATNGATCGFASLGPEIDVIAPGCGLDGASPFDLAPLAAEGSSFAAAMVSQVTAALRSYKPELGAGDVEAALAGQDSLNVDALFRDHGLGHVIDDGLTTAPHARVPSGRARFPRPRLKLFRSVHRCRRRHEFIGRRCGAGRRPYRRVGRRVVVRVRDLPLGALLELRVVRSPAKTRRRTHRISVRPPKGWRTLAVRFVPARGVSTLASSAVFIRRR